MASTTDDEGFAKLEKLMRARRDVRHFRTDPVPRALIEEAIRLAVLAPSVGYSQPWRWVSVEDEGRRATVIASHDAANASARTSAHAEREEEYGRLKLSGLREAPVHLAVFCDTASPGGGGLGRQTMPETLEYSVVMAIYGFWLAARALGIGVGWVSILEPEVVVRALDVPPGWRLVAYLAVGYPAFDSETPELAERGWEEHNQDAARLLVR
jgi:5,6-dimethylbenzimidazole synthase